MMKVLIVDDEPLAQQELRILLENEPDLQIVGSCNNAIEAIKAINNQNIDVVFLDIQMPRINGLEMVGMLDPSRAPKIVFLTAHDEYAIKAFEEHAYDYLLKPIEQSRLQKTLQHLKRDTPQSSTALKPLQILNQIPCHGVNRIFLLKLNDVESVTSKEGGVYVIGVDGKENFTELTLKTIEERTPFLRCHRQYLVNPNQIREIRFTENNLAEIITHANRTIPVSRRFLSALQNNIGLS